MVAPLSSPTHCLLEPSSTETNRAPATGNLKYNNSIVVRDALFAQSEPDLYGMLNTPATVGIALFTSHSHEDIKLFTIQFAQHKR